MLEIASQMILCLLLAALLGFIIGYLLGKSTCLNDDCGDTSKTIDRTNYNKDYSKDHNKDYSKTTAKKIDTDNTVRNTAAAGIASTGVAAASYKDSISTPREDLSSKVYDNTATERTTTTVITEKAEVKPELLSGPRNGKKDNLTRIKGIGMKIDGTLNDLGIYHFDQIAGWSEKHALWIDSQTAFPGRVQRENWVDQAKALASGQETEFSKRVDSGEVSSSKKH